MKSILSVTFALFAMGLAREASASVCSYSLDQEEYWERADGDLVMDGEVFRCRSLTVGKDKLTACQQGAGSPDVYDVIVYFDGAEGNFTVFDGLFEVDQPLCKGIATSKTLR